MKLNNKGFAITLVLYGTLVLFLLLLVSLLGILSTYKLRLEKIYPEEETPQLTCNFTATYSAPTTTIQITVNDESLLHDTPYSYWGEWVTNSTQYNSKIASYTIKVRDRKGNIVDCGKVYFNYKSVTKYIFTGDVIECCPSKKTDDLIIGDPICQAFMLGDGYTYHDTAAAAINQCKAICSPGFDLWVYGCQSKAVSVSTPYIVIEKAS